MKRNGSVRICAVLVIVSLIIDSCGSIPAGAWATPVPERQGDYLAPFLRLNAGGVQGVFSRGEDNAGVVEWFHSAGSDSARIEMVERMCPRGILAESALIALLHCADFSSAFRAAIIPFVVNIGAIAVPGLLDAAESTDSNVVRLWLATAVKKIGPASIPFLVDALLRTSSADLAAWIVLILGDLGPVAVPALLTALVTADSDSDTVYLRITGALLRIGSASLPQLIELLGADTSEEVQLWLVWTLGELRTAAVGAVPALSGLFTVTHSEDIRRWIAFALEKIGPAASAASSVLINAIQEKAGLKVLSAVIPTLVYMAQSEPAIVPQLIAAFETADTDDVRYQILQTLWDIPIAKIPVFFAFNKFAEEQRALNWEPMDISLQAVVGGEIDTLLETKGRTMRFTVRGKDGVYNFKYLDEGKEVEELLKELILLKAIENGVVDVTVDKNDIPEIVSYSSIEKSLFRIDGKVGIVYRTTEDYFSYVTQDISVGASGRTQKRAAVARGLSAAFRLLCDLWQQGIIRDEHVYHNTAEFNWFIYYSYEKSAVGSILRETLQEWLRYPNIGLRGLRDYGHYVVDNELELSDALNKIGDVLVYYTIVAAAAFYRNGLKESDFESFIEEKYRSLGVVPYRGFGGEFWRLANSRPAIATGRSGSRGVMIKPESWEAIYQGSLAIASWMIRYPGAESGTLFSSLVGAMCRSGDAASAFGCPQAAIISSL